MLFTFWGIELQISVKITEMSILIIIFFVKYLAEYDFVKLS